MEKTLLTVMIVLALASTAFAQGADLQALKDNTKEYAPLKVRQKGKVLTLVMNEKVITPSMYENVVFASICAPIYINPKKELFVDVKEIEILHMFEKKGFVFENPYKTCKEVGSLKGNQFKAVFWGNTRSF